MLNQKVNFHLADKYLCPKQDSTITGINSSISDQKCGAGELAGMIFFIQNQQ
jgi:hypothetical protein